MYSAVHSVSKSRRPGSKRGIKPVLHILVEALPAVCNACVFLIVDFNVLENVWVEKEFAVKGKSSKKIASIVLYYFQVCSAAQYYLIAGNDYGSIPLVIML